MSVESGKQIRYQGKYITAPDQYASNIKRLSALPCTSDCLILLASPLLADGLPEYIQSSKTQAFFVCIDFEPALQEFLLSRVAALAGLRVKVIHHQSESDTKSILERIIHELGIRQIFLQALSGGFSLHSKAYYSLLEYGKKIIFNIKQNKLTRRYFMRRWIKNLFANIIQRPAWDTIHIEKPVFLLGAGPSAEPYLAFLQEHREKFFLLVVDSVLPALASSRISPDLIIVQDAQLINAADLIPNCWKHTPVLSDLTAHPSITRQLPAAYFISTFAPIRLLDRLVQTTIPCIPNLGSVGISAYYLIRRYYQGVLFLAGMDMHYVPGKSHVSMSAGHRHTLATTQRLSQGKTLQLQYNRHTTQTHDKHARPCKTDVVLQGYAELFSSLLGSDAKAWDVGESGLAIGAEQMEQGQLLAYLAKLEQRSYTMRIEALKNPYGFITKERNQLEAFLGAGSTEEKSALAHEISYIHDGEDREEPLLGGYAEMSAGDYLSYLKRKILALSRLENREKSTLR